MSNISARSALAHSITNDRRGVVSNRDAKRIVNAGLEEIQTSDNPIQTMENAQRFVSAGRTLVGRDPSAIETLADFRQQGQAAVRQRLAELTGNTQLPTAALRAFDELLGPYGTLEVEGPAKFTNVSGDDANGYTFDWSAGNKSGKALAITHEGYWLLADKPVPKTIMDAAVKEMRAYFDDYFAEDQLEYGDTQSEVDSMRDSIGISSIMWAGDSDPVGANSDYDYAFVMDNPTGSDHGFYVGVDKDGTAMADSFN